MTRYLVIIEQSEAGAGFGPYVPDLPGCVAVGDTYEKVKEPTAWRWRVVKLARRPGGLRHS